jgi:hypothetical protein
MMQAAAEQEGVPQPRADVFISYSRLWPDDLESIQRLRSQVIEPHAAALAPYRVPSLLALEIAAARRPTWDSR